MSREPVIVPLFDDHKATLGKNLNREELEEGFNKCRVEGSAPKKQKTSA